MNANELTITINSDTKGVQAAEKELGRLEKSVYSVRKAVTESTGSWTKYSSVITACSTSFMAVKTAVEQYVIAPLASAVQSFMALGDQISKTSQRVGMSTETLGGLKFAAEQCGANFQILTDGIKTFQNQLGAAKMGDAGAIGKLGKIGLSAEDFAGLSNEEQLMKVADHIAAIGDKSEQTRVSIEAFGKAGFKLLPFFQEGSEGIKKLIAEGKDIGAVMGEEATAEAVAMADAMNRMKTSAAGVTNSLVSMLAPAMIKTFDAITTVTKSTGKFLKNWGDLVGLFTGAVALFLSWPSIIAGITAAFAGLTAGVHALTAAVAMNPIGAIAIAAVAAGVGIVALVRHFTQATTAEKKLTDSTKEVNAAITDLNKTIEAGEKKMEEMNSESEKLKDTISRLEELNEKESLNNKEKRENVDLIDELNRKMPQLGVEIDKNTGKIQNFNEAMAAAVKSEAATQTEALTKQQFELARKAEGLDKKRTTVIKELRNLQKDSSLDFARSGYDVVEDEDLTSEQKRKKLQPLSKAAHADEKKYYKLAIAALDAEDAAKKARQEIKNLESQKREVDKDAHKTTQEIFSNTLASSKDQIKKFNEEKKWEAASPAERKMMDHNKEYKTQKEALEKAIASAQAIIDDEREKTEAEGEDLLWHPAEDQIKGFKKQLRALKKWHKSEKGKIDAELEEEELAEAAKEQPHIFIDEKDDRLAAAEQKVAEAREKQAQAILENSGVQEADEELEKAQENLAKVTATVSGEERARAKSRLDSAKREQKTAENRYYMNEIDAAELDEFTQEVIDAQKDYDAANERYFKAVGALRKDQETPVEEEVQDAVQTTLSSSGTFSAYGLDAVATSDIPKQTLEVLKKLLDNTDEIKKEQKNDAAYTEE